MNQTMPRPNAPTEIDFNVLNEVDINGKAIEFELADLDSDVDLAPRLLRHGAGTAVIAVRPGQELVVGDYLSIDAVERVAYLAAVAASRTVLPSSIQLTLQGVVLTRAAPISATSPVINCLGSICSAGDYGADVNCQIFDESGSSVVEGSVRLRSQ